MSKAKIAISKPQSFFKRHPGYLQLMIIPIVIIGGYILLFAITGNRLPIDAWLPESSHYESDDDAIYYLPIKGKTTVTKYGIAVRYQTTTNWPAKEEATDPWTTILEFQSSPLLKPSSCPNVDNSETESPSGCEKLGTFQGQPVYTMHRSLPSGTTEYYVTLDQTLIYIRMCGDGGESLGYLNTFVHLSRDKVDAYLANNHKRVDAAISEQQAEENAAKQNDALAYTRLDFTPALPTNLPSGWQVASDKIRIDGPDADHPSMVNVEYANGSEQYVDVYSVKLSSSTVGTQCGPSPGYAMENLACHKVAGTDYYESIPDNTSGDFVRFLYRPVGDSLVISEITAFADANRRPGFPTELAKVQDSITLSAQPTDKTRLKGSMYDQTYY